MTEEWRPVPHFDKYEVSNFGRVRSLDRYVARGVGGIALHRGRIRKLSLHRKTGYLYVEICQDDIEFRFAVHRLVALVFLPPSDLPEVNHLDFNRANNRASNLEWTDRLGNDRHARMAGRTPSKLKPPDFPAIHARYGDGETLRSIARDYDVLPKTIGALVHGSSWQ